MSKFSIEVCIRLAVVGMVLASFTSMAHALPPVDGPASTPEIGTASIASAVALLGFGMMALRRRFH